MSLDDSRLPHPTASPTRNGTPTITRFHQGQGHEPRRAHHRFEEALEEEEVDERRRHGNDKDRVGCALAGLGEIGPRQRAKKRERLGPIFP